MKLNQYIDHTILKMDTSNEDVIKVCQEAKKYNFCSVCIPPSYVKLAAEELKGSSVKVCTVIGFALGYSTSKNKVLEATEAIKDGAQEIDIVINVAKVKARDKHYLVNEINAIKKAIEPAILKVIVETSMLTEADKIFCCELLNDTNADFIKTSTGFNGGGATIEDVVLFKKHLKPQKEIKASGRVRDQQFAIDLINAGATRLGTSSGVNLVNNQKVDLNQY